MRQSRVRTAALLALILAVGLGVRLLGIHWGHGYQFSAIGDEIQAYQVALNLLSGDPAAWYLGQPNFRAGKLPGPLWALFWAAGLQLGGPEGVMGLMALLGTAAIGLVFILGREMLGTTAGLWAAALYATAPLPALYASGCHNPGLMAPLGALLYWSLWRVLSRDRAPQVFWVPLVLAALPQIHMFGLFLLPPLVLLLVWRRRSLHLPWLVAGGVAGLLLQGPYLWGEWINHWENSRQLLLPAGRLTLGSFKVLVTPLASLANLVDSGVGPSLVAYRRFGDAAFGAFPVLLGLNLLSLGIAALALGHWLGRLPGVLGWDAGDGGPTNRLVRIKARLRNPDLFKSQDRAGAASCFLALLLLPPLLLFIPTWATFNGRYAILCHPLLFLVPALWQADDGRRSLVRGALGLLLVINAWVTLALFHHQGERIAYAEELIPSFRVLEDVSQRIRADAGPAGQPRLELVGFPRDPDAPSTHGALMLARYMALGYRADPGAAWRPYRLEPDRGGWDLSMALVARRQGLRVLRQR